MGTALRSMQSLMAPAAAARGAVSGASSVYATKPCATHPVIENFGDRTIPWPEEAPL